MIFYKYYSINIIESQLFNSFYFQNLILNKFNI
nr:MAG TPA: hypothetical protein [Caudoviricetes sp.]